MSGLSITTTPPPPSFGRLIDERLAGGEAIG
jgi:hypothetical protein